MVLTERKQAEADEARSEFDFVKARRRRRNLRRVAVLLVLALAGYFGWRYWAQRPQLVWSKSWPTTNAYRHQSAMKLVLANGYLYGLAADNTVHVVNAQNGKEVWRFKPGAGKYAAGLAVTGKEAVVLVKPERQSRQASGSEVASLDAFTGRERWRQPAGVAVRDTALVVTGDGVYFIGGGSDGSGAAEKLIALDLSGNAKWQAPLAEGARLETVGASVIAVQPTRVEAFAAGDGRSLWTYDVRPETGYGSIPGIPRLIDVIKWRDRVLLWQAPDRFFVRDADSGELLDRYRPTGLLSKGFGKEALIVGDTLFVYSQFIRSGYDDLRAINLEKKEVNWKRTVPARYSGWPFGTSSYDSRPLAYAKDTVYLGARDGLLRGYRGATGRPVYAKRVYSEGGGFDWNTGPLAYHNMIFITEPGYRKGSQTPVDIAAYKAA